MHSLLVFYNNTPHLCKEKLITKSSIYIYLTHMTHMIIEKTMRRVALMITHFTVLTQKQGEVGLCGKNKLPQQGNSKCVLVKYH